VLDRTLGLLEGQALEGHSAIREAQRDLPAGLNPEDAVDRGIRQAVFNLDVEKVSDLDTIFFFRDRKR
jgi:hypothetical protein